MVTFGMFDSIILIKFLLPEGGADFSCYLPVGCHSWSAPSAHIARSSCAIRYTCLQLVNPFILNSHRHRRILRLLQTLKVGKSLKAMVKVVFKQNQYVPLTAT